MTIVRNSQGLALAKNSRKFPKTARLLKRCQFVELANRRNQLELKISVGSFLVVGKDNNLGWHRLGITVTKKVGSAVTRNYLKRTVREFFRLNHDQWPGSWDLVFIAGPKAGGLLQNQLKTDLDRAGRKLQSWSVAGCEKVAKYPGANEKTVNCKESVNCEKSAGYEESVNCEKYISDEESASCKKSVSCEKHPQRVGEPVINTVSPLQALLLIPKYLALWAIGFYRRFISPMLPPSCRFWPTCSTYATEAFTIHGFWWGGWLTMRRLLKCHPFHPGGYDPVPRCLTTPRSKLQVEKPGTDCNHPK